MLLDIRDIFKQRQSFRKLNLNQCMFLKEFYLSSCQYNLKTIQTKTELRKHFFPTENLTLELSSDRSEKAKLKVKGTQLKKELQA